MIRSDEGRQNLSKKATGVNPQAGYRRPAEKISWEMFWKILKQDIADLEIKLKNWRRKNYKLKKKIVKIDN